MQKRCSTEDHFGTDLDSNLNEDLTQNHGKSCFRIGGTAMFHISFFNVLHEFSLSNVRHIVELSRFVGSIWSKQTVRNIIYFKLVLSGYFYTHV